MSDTGFRGFPPETLSFLKNLRRNNRKEWFDAHRADYEAYYLMPAKQFVVALGPRLAKFAKGVQFEPAINGSIARINRDIRFAKDKSPYKDHLDLWFWLGAQRGWDMPGFFFRLSPPRLILGVGMHMFGKAQLEAYRKAVVGTSGAALTKTITALERAGYTVGSATRKTVPRGFDRDHPRAALLLHDGLHASWEGPVPREAQTAKFADWCAAHYRALWPLAKWIQTSV